MLTLFEAELTTPLVPKATTKYVLVAPAATTTLSLHFVFETVATSVPLR